MDAGIIGGILGTAMGFLGGAIGTYYSISNTHSPRERTFVVRASILIWILIALLLLGLYFLPRPYNFTLFIPYGIFMLVGIPYMNRRQAEIRSRESAQNDNNS